MNELTLSGEWNEIHGKLKQHYGQYMNNDLVYKHGMHDELLGRLQKKLGKSKDGVIKSKDDIIKIILTGM